VRQLESRPNPPGETVAEILFFGGLLRWDRIGTLALLNLDPGENAWKAVFQGPLASRELFTPKGWTFRNIASICFVRGVLLVFFGM
jgi:hypothetical protein